MEKSKALISILNYNGSEDTVACIKSFYNYENKEDFSIVVWDNASSNENLKLLKEQLQLIDVEIKICSNKEYLTINLPDYNLVLVESDTNLGFSKANNEVIKDQLSKFEFVVLLNNDTEFVENTTNRLIKYLDAHDSVGIVTSAIYYYYQKELIWNAGAKTYFGTRKYYTVSHVKRILKSSQIEKEVDHITGCYFVVKSSILKKYGLLTERFFFGEEDYEFCKRMKRNKVKMVVLFNEKMYHKVGASINRNPNTLAIVRKSFIYHLNRFIDMKFFYHRYLWDLWRMFSSVYIFFLMLRISHYNYSMVLRYIKLLNYYSKERNDVSRVFFLAVLNGDIL